MKEQLGLLDEVIERAKALMELKAIKLHDIGAHILPDKSHVAQYARAYEWMISRKYAPSGEQSLRIKAFIDAKAKSLKGDDLKAFNDKLNK